MLIERSRALPNSRADRERGASSLEYGALIVVAALVVGVLGTLVSTKVEGHVSNAICDLFQAQCTDTQQRTSADGDGPGPEPSPSPGPPVPQPPPPKPSKEQTETESVLNETQLGRDALKWVKDHGVRVVYRAGGGSYYDGDANVFYVDTNQTPEERANTFVHEVNHAEHRDDPDIDDLSREDFIDKSIDEETEGTVEAIQNNQQLQRNRGGNSPDTLLQQEYEDAYNDAVRRENAARAKAQRPPLDAAGEKAVGEKAGRERVKQAFVNGEVVSSVDGNKYADNYGKAWDDAHDCFLWIFC
ncbi:MULTISPECIES: ImmA/IrrE family metallo-endopeptidase [Actinomadura]|uniref:ImmA/IrrE family metallo-endopeptidase n=1 Tax=Actinomadura TaxID=1988 RepID=UPI00040FD049|nr:ImmA/IrrE family metallo-endopeptidase [Actinomadura madurae]